MRLTSSCEGSRTYKVKLSASIAVEDIYIIPQFVTSALPSATSLLSKPNRSKIEGKALLMHASLMLPSFLI